jgi:succinate-semialdehyde dehydrogenase/glutarate-semialdehyde dehydrogenase
MTVSEPPDAETASTTIDADERVAGLIEYVTLADDGQETFTVEAPFTGDPIGAVPACRGADVEAAVERAERAQNDWADREIEERADIALDVHDRLLDESERLLDLMQLEGGKARRTAHEGLLYAAISCRHYAVRAEDYLEPERRKGALPGLTKTWENHHPIGVVGIITPWNYPLSLVIADAIPALLAGNAVVLEPAEETPYTALLVAEILHEAGVPENLFQVITGNGSELGPPLIENSDYIGFTGSTETGRTVASQAGENLIKCSMELGGKNPGVVLPDADIEKAAAGLVRGCFTNAGQLCIAIERLYVHEDIREEFMRAFVGAIEDMRMGAGFEYGPDMGTIISETQFETVKEHVEDARTNGATVLTGGRARPDLGPYFYEPTVLTDVPEDALPAYEETFGPVVSVYGVESTEEAIERANDSKYGLNASVWMENEELGRDVARQIECGTVNVNEGYAATQISVDSPMGGMKQSGIGRRHGDEGILKYTESQTVAVQRGMGLTNPPGVPYGVYATAMNTAVRIMKRVPGLR